MKCKEHVELERSQTKSTAQNGRQKITVISQKIQIMVVGQRHSIKYV